MEVRCDEVTFISIEKLKQMFHPKNRNVHPPEQIERLAKILDYQGVRSPARISHQSGYITAGHGRILAAEKLGWTEYPVDYQDYDSEDQEYADLQADNAIASWASLDLSGINFDLGSLGPDFDVDLLGIKDFVIEPADKMAPQCDEDEVPEKVEPKTKRGDIYQIGPHRLLCGDSTSITDVEKLMVGEKADMVFTDPPYNIGLDYHEYDDEKSDDAFEGLLREVFNTSYGLLQDKGHCLFTMGHKWMFRTKTIVEECGFDFRHLGIWHNPQRKSGGNPGMWPISYEAVLDFTKNGFRKLNNGNSVGHMDVWIEAPTHETGHPAQKPIALWAYLLELCTDPKDSIYDPFGGSGSTIIACEKTNRRCFMMELDPNYCDVIIARWEKYTGKKAEILHG